MTSEIILSVLEGVCVRWWDSPAVGARPIAYASRNKVEYLVDVGQVPADVVDAAEAVHRELMRNADAEVVRYVTHRRATPFSPLEPIPGRI